MLSKGRIKELTSLHLKKYRSARNMFLAEGDKLVREAIRSSAQVEEIFAMESWAGAEKAIQSGIPVTFTGERELKQLCELKSPNEAVALVHMPKHIIEEVEFKGHWNIYMDRLRDPGNLGTIMRIADWFGLERIICSPDSVEPYNQKVIQASMGAVFRIEVIAMEEDVMLAQARAAQVPIYAAAMGTLSIDTLAAGPEGIVLMGNEAQGLSNKLLEAADQRISIPGKGAAESLNVAVAAGILMHWIQRG